MNWRDEYFLDTKRNSRGLEHLGNGWVQRKFCDNGDCTYTQERTKMRNKISVIDPSYPNLTFADIEIGQLFKYRTSNEIYMRIVTDNTKINAVLLATGVCYAASNDHLVCKISSVNITSS